MGIEKLDKVSLWRSNAHVATETRLTAVAHVFGRLRQLCTWSSWQPRDNGRGSGDLTGSTGHRGSLDSALETLIKS